MSTTESASLVLALVVVCSIKELQRAWREWHPNLHHQSA
jgi:hypothetical protein